MVVGNSEGVENVREALDVEALSVLLMQLVELE